MPSRSYTFAFTRSNVSDGSTSSVIVLPAARQRTHKHFNAAAQQKHQVDRRLLLHVVVRQRALVLPLLAREDQPRLLLRGNALLVLHSLTSVILTFRI